MNNRKGKLKRPGRINTLTRQQQQQAQRHRQQQQRQQQEQEQEQSPGSAAVAPDVDVDLVTTGRGEATSTLPPQSALSRISGIEPLTADGLRSARLRNVLRTPSHASPTQEAKYKDKQHANNPESPPTGTGSAVPLLTPCSALARRRKFSWDVAPNSAGVRPGFARQGSLEPLSAGSGPYTPGTAGLRETGSGGGTRGRNGALSVVKEVSREGTPLSSLTPVGLNSKKLEASFDSDDEPGSGWMHDITRPTHSPNSASVTLTIERGMSHLGLRPSPRRQRSASGSGSRSPTPSSTHSCGGRVEESTEPQSAGWTLDASPRRGEGVDGHSPLSASSFRTQGSRG